MRVSPFSLSFTSNQNKKSENNAANTSSVKLNTLNSDMVSFGIKRPSEITETKLQKAKKAIIGAGQDKIKPESKEVAAQTVTDIKTEPDRYDSYIKYSDPSEIDNSSESSRTWEIYDRLGDTAV